MLLLGDSGTGKTGASASLAAAGYRLRIADFDRGVDVLKNLLTDSDSPYAKSPFAKDYGKNVVFETIEDPKTIIAPKPDAQGKVAPGSGKIIETGRMWQSAMDLLMNWPQLGPITSWGSEDILVIDSFSSLSEAAMRFILALNGRLGQKPWQSDIGEAQGLLAKFLEFLVDPSVRCNVIINCHIKFLGEENEPQKGYPSTIGKALPPQVGKHFNTTLQAVIHGTGQNAKRMILTQPQLNIGLKNTAPFRVKPSYDLSTGLADYFLAVRGSQPAPSGKGKS